VFVALAHHGGMIEAARHYDLRLDEGWEFAGTLALDVERGYLLGE
jgi:hypothetical protein